MGLLPAKIQGRKCASTKGTGMSLPLLDANGRMLAGETLQNVGPLRRQNTFASFGPARNSKDNNVPISGGGVFSNTWIDREFDINPIMK
jgi:hypothetical protein